MGLFSLFFAAYNTVQRLLALCAGPLVDAGYLILPPLFGDW